MQAAVARIERNVDRASAALFAGACAYAAYAWFAPQAAQPMLVAETGAVAALAYLLCVRALGAIQPKPRKLPMQIFDVRQIDPHDPPDMLPAATEPEPLVLDDILGELGPDSRVVRLFDPAAMPTPGQLNDRIERHLGRDVPPIAPPDASQALRDALAELRRSLR